jgi:ribosomal protein S18 acetylase RimI-like enzyme
MESRASSSGVVASAKELKPGAMTTLLPMRPARYAAYLESAITGYAQDNVSAGRWTEVGALERSREDFASLLPQGLATPEHFLYEIMAHEGGPTVGCVWVHIERKFGVVSAYVYDLEIEPAFRRQGHAERALRALEALAVAAGAGGIGLNVFADNVGAQALYRKLDYVTTNFNMRKALD